MGVVFAVLRVLELKLSLKTVVCPRAAKGESKVQAAAKVDRCFIEFMRSLVVGLA